MSSKSNVITERFIKPYFYYFTMDTNQTERKSSRFRKAAKLAGKTLLTLVSPPIGLAIFTKNRFTGFSAGILLSALIALNSMGFGLLGYKKIYDEPFAKLAGEAIGPRLVVEQDRATAGFQIVAPLLISPLPAFFPGFTYNNVLNITEGDRKYSVVGDNVLIFDREKGQYVLDFSNVRNLSYNGESFSLTKARSKLESLSREHDKLLSQGDIIRAREKYAELESAQAVLIEAEVTYEVTERAYKDAVERMNKDLEIQSIQKKALTGERK